MLPNWIILRAKTGISLIALLLLTLGNCWPAAGAGTQYWDSDGNAANNNTTTGAGLGGMGSGLWGGATNWYNGTIDGPWVDSSDAVFWGTSSAIITLPSQQNVNSLAFKTTGYVLQGSTLNLAGSSVTVDAGVAASLVSTLAGSGGLVKSGAGALHLVGTSNTYTGGTTVNAGTLGIVSGSLGALPASPVINVTLNNNSTLRFNADAVTVNVNRQILLGTGGGTVLTNGFNATIAGVISGTSLTKTGAGTLTLTNNNTYTDGTTVGGNLLVNNTTGSGTGTGAVLVSSGILGGTGTIQGNVTNNGIVGPGNTVGALHLGGSYTQGTGGILQIELASLASHDELFVNSAASLAGGLTVSLPTGFAPQFGNVFEIMTASGFGGSTFTSTSLPALTGNLGWSVNYGATAVTLSVGLAGDFNGSGTVDAADYPVWRAGLGTTYTATDFNAWRSHFGLTGPGAGSGAGLSTGAVPEPASLFLLGVGMCLSLPSRRRGCPIV